MYTEPGSLYVQKQPLRLEANFDVTRPWPDDIFGQGAL